MVIAVNFQGLRLTEFFAGKPAGVGYLIGGRSEMTDKWFPDSFEPFTTNCKGIKKTWDSHSLLISRFEALTLPCTFLMSNGEASRMYRLPTIYATLSLESMEQVCRRGYTPRAFFAACVLKST